MLRVARHNLNSAARLSRTFALCAAALAYQAGLSPAAQADLSGCLTTPLKKALAKRHEQTQFMVAALQCRGANSKAVRAGYTRYIALNNKLLRSGAPIVRAWLSSRGLGSIDDYLTSLANDAAFDAVTIPGFCTAAGKALRLLKTDGQRPVASSGPKAPIAFQPPEPDCSTSANSAAAIAVE